MAEGSLDAAFVAIAGQIELPKGVTGQVVGVDRIGVLAPATCDLHSTDRREFAGRTVVTYTTDYSGEELMGIADMMLASQQYQFDAAARRED